MIAADLRREFPQAESSIYLDSAAVGLVPASVTDAVRDADASPFGTARPAEISTAVILDRVESELRLLFATGTGRCLVTSSAMATVAGALAELLAGDRGNVIAFTDDYPDLIAICKHRAEQRGFELRLVEVAGGASPAQRADALLEAVNSETVAVVVSHIHWATGAELPLNKLTHARERGGFMLIVDVTHSLGIARLPVADLAIDLAVSAGYKWLLGGFGAAPTFMSDAMRERLAASCWPTADVLTPTTMSYAAALQLALALRWARGVGREAIIRSIRDSVSELRAQLQRAGAQLLPDGGAGIVAADFLGIRADTLARAARRRNVHISARSGIVRLSPHIYTQLASIPDAVSALQACADELAR